VIKRKALFSFIFFLFVATLKSQPTLDTIKYSLTQAPHLFFKFDSRYSFIDNSSAKMLGVKVGLNYGNRLNLGIGYNQLSPKTTGFDETVYYMNQAGRIESTTKELKLFYISVDVEYIFYTPKHWQLSMPLKIGVGDNYYKYTIQGVDKRVEESLNFVYEPTISIEYKPIRFIGVGADVGYRFMVNEHRKLNQKFTSYIIGFKFLIYYSEIYKYFFPKSKLIH